MKKSEPKFEELEKFIKGLVEDYDMTESQYDLWEDIMKKIKKIKKS